MLTLHHPYIEVWILLWVDILNLYDVKNVYILYHLESPQDIFIFVILSLLLWGGRQLEFQINNYNKELEESGNLSPYLLSNQRMLISFGIITISHDMK